MLTAVFGSQLQDGLGILSVKACTNRPLSATYGILNISYHSFSYSVAVIISQKQVVVKRFGIVFVNLPQILGFSHSKV